MASEKRLTEKHYSGNGYYLNCSSDCPNDGFCDDCEKLYKAIDRLGEYEDKAEQTVEAVEVVHGRWLKLSPWNNHTQSCLCLNCDSISYQKKSGVYIGKIPNYCPNCGAKMDGDGNG